MDIEIVGTQLTLTLENTSPTTLNSGTGTNTAAIRGFGFDIDPNLVPTTWELTAFADSAQTTPIILGKSDGSATLWTMGTSLPMDTTRDFLPQSDAGGSKGSIYNPATGLPSTSGGESFYFSTAKLVMTFGTMPMLDMAVQPYVRMQRVGNDGSLKLFGNLVPNGGDDPVVPEPGALALFGMGVLCCSAYAVRRKRKLPA